VHELHVPAVGIPVKQRYASPCPICTFHGQVEAGGVSADVFCCVDRNGPTDPEYGILMLAWGNEGDYDQHDTYCFAQGIEDPLGGRPRVCVGELDDVPLRDLWAQALLLIVKDARTKVQTTASNGASTASSTPDASD
jgi:hypothetical protein